MMKSKNFFERFANWAAKFTGSSAAFIIATLIVIIWAVTGPVFNYSATWQLVINTGTTIITFLMVFLIQKAQNKDSKAIQIKLNELIASNEKASNRIVDIEILPKKNWISCIATTKCFLIMRNRRKIFINRILSMQPGRIRITNTKLLRKDTKNGYSNKIKKRNLNDSLFIIFS